MPTDVGSARVEIKGDVRSFARDAERELNDAVSKIKINPVDIPVDTDGIRKSAQEAGEILGEGVTRGADGKLRDSRGQFVRMGEEAGELLGEGIARGADGKLRDSRGRFVRMGEDAGKATGDGVRRGAESSLGKNRFSQLLKNAFTPHPGIFDALRAPFQAALATPIGAAVISVAATAAAAFVAAFATSIATAGLGAVFLGLGAAALFGAKKSRDEAQADLDKAEERVRKAQERAKSGTAAAKRSLADARAELAKAKAAVEDNAAFEKLDSSLGKLGKTLQNVGKSASAPLMKPFTDALNILSDKALALTPLLHGIFSALAPAIVPLTEGIAGFVEEFLKVLTADPKTLESMRDSLIALGENLPRLGKLLGDVFTLFASNENNVRNIGLLFGALEISVTAIAVALFALSKVLDAIISAWDRTREAWSDAVDWITQTAVPAIIDAVGSIGDFFSKLPETVSQAWSSITGFISRAVGTVVSLLTALPGRVIGAISSIPGIVSGVFTSAWNMARSVVSTGISNVVGIIRGLPGRMTSALSGVRSAVTSAFSGAAGWLASAGRNIINGLLSGIRAMIPSVRGLLGSITSMLPDWKGPAEVDRTILRESGRMVMQGFQRGIEDQRSAIERTLRGFTGDLPGISSPAMSAGGSSASMSVVFQPGSIVINGQGASAGQEAAEMIFARLGQARMAM